MFDDLEDLRKKSIGCMIVVLVLMGGAYFWMAGSSSSNYGESKPPPPGTIEEVDWLLLKSKPDEALAACRKLKSDSKPETQTAAKSRMPKCLEQVYWKKISAKDLPGCESIAKETATDCPNTPESQRIAEQWRRNMLTWAVEAAEKGDFTLAERLFADYRKDPKASRDLCWAYEKYLAKRWPKALEANDLAFASRLFADYTADPLLKECGNIPWQHQLYLHARAKKAIDSNDMAETSRVFDELVALLKNNATSLDLTPYEDLLSARITTALKTNDRATLEPLVELISKNTAHGPRKTPQILFQLYMRTKWLGEMESGDDKAATATLEELDRHASLLDWKWRRDQLAEYRWLRSRKAHESGNQEEARKFLTALVGDEHSSIAQDELQKAMAAEWTTAELESMADNLMAKRDPDSALEFYDSARKAGGGSESLESKTEACLLAVADQVFASASKYVDFKSFDEAERVYTDLVFHRDSVKKKPDFWMKSAQNLIKLQVEYARLLSANDMFPRAEEELNKASRQVAVAMWDACRQETAYDPWNGVPPEIIRQIEQRNPSADAAERLDTLRTMARQGRFFVPQAEPVRAMLQKVRIQKALHDIDLAVQDLRFESRHETAFDLFRGVLRNYPDSEASEKARKELQMAINGAYGQHEFSKLNDLLGFYIAEVGPPATDDPYRSQLKQSLQETAEAFRKTSPMTRIFLLSLLADSLPDDPDARAAKEEVLTKGMDVIAQLPAQAMNQPSRKVPCLLPGFSVLCVENKTRYHLMIFLKGPETFYVRVNPFRRGCIVLKDGAYTQAVVVTRDDVIPYRGEPKYAGETQFSGYYIATKDRSGKSAPDEAEQLQAVTGDYTLLRAPADAGSLFVHPDSGLVLKLKPPKQ